SMKPVGNKAAPNAGCGWPPPPALPSSSSTPAAAWQVWPPCWATSCAASCAATALASTSCGQCCSGESVGPTSNATSKNAWTAVEPALWRFVVSDGVEPTNNHAERLLRSGVLWRKTSFGCHSADGCRFVERMLTVVQTLRLQQRNVLNFLHDTLRAHRTGQALPQLIAE